MLPDFVYFTKEIYMRNETRKEKQQATEDISVQDSNQSLKKSVRKLTEYQSFQWGSNGIRNSCFIDSFLEVIYHVWARQKKKMLPEELEEALFQRGSKNFHRSKMVLWQYLQDHAINNYDTFTPGDMGAITAVIDCLYSNIPTHERSNYYLLNETQTKCLTNNNHNKQRLSHYPLFYLYRKYITFDLIDESNTFDLCTLVEFVLNDNCVENSVCHVCQKQQSITIKVMNNPAFFFIEVQQDTTSKIKPALRRTNIKVNKCQYDLAGVIYFSAEHFWTQHFVNAVETQPGYYFYNDLKYKGRAKFLSKSVKNLTPENIHILIFEKTKYNKDGGTASGVGEEQIVKSLIERAHAQNIVASKKTVKENIATLIDYAGIQCDGYLKRDLIEAIVENRDVVESVLERRGRKRLKNDRKATVSESSIMSEHSYSIHYTGVHHGDFLLAKK